MPRGISGLFETKRMIQYGTLGRSWPAPRGRTATEPIPDRCLTIPSGNPEIDPNLPLIVSTAWDKLPRESSSAYERFLHYRDQGPERTQTATAERFGVSKASLSETAQRFRWISRARTWDQAIERHPLPAVPTRLLGAAGTVSERAAKPIEPVSAEVREAEQEHEAMLEIFRQEAEAVGRSQMKLARGFTAAAGKNVARLMAGEKPLTARDVATLAQVSCTLAASATSLWGRAIGVDRVLAQMQSVVQMEQREVEEAEIVG